MNQEPVRVERQGEVFVVTMDAGENRWNTTFTRSFAAALDEVEASEGPAALVTVSSDEKFFSNGLDLEWITSRDAGDDHPGGDRRVFVDEFMTLASRLITFPVPTVAAIGGHGFGAGFMIALCHDTRVMRRDRGYLCANEIELGMAIPEPELALFRHKMTLPAFLETVQFARRWTAPDAHAAGFVQHVADADELVEQAMSVAARQARLGANRKVFGWMKEHIHGENAAISGPHGAAYMLAHPHEFSHGPGRG